MAENDKGAGDDPAMAQSDRAGYSVDIQSMTGGKLKDITEGGTREVGMGDSVGNTDILPKV